MKAWREAAPGEFSTSIEIGGDPQAYAAAHGARLLVDDGEGDPNTAMLVTPTEVVRVTIADGAITGLCAHVDRDDVPDRLTVARSTFTRGDRLRVTLEAAPALPPGATPEQQDAEHELLMVLRALVRRPATPDDERAVRRTAAQLRRSGAASVSDILRCADDVLAAPWDPAEPA